MIERTTVRLPADLMARARRKAAANGSTLTSLIEEALRRVVDHQSKLPVPSKRVLPRISKARGWLLPGLTLRDIDDRDDLEYIERMKHFK